MKIPRIQTLAALGALALVGSASAATTFNGGDIHTSTDWTNGLPASGNDGTIAVGGSAGSTSILWGGTVTQTAGDIVATGTNGCNLRNGTTWNMSGGSFAARYFNANGAHFIATGGTFILANTGTSVIQTNGTGTWTIGGSFSIDATFADGAPSTTGAGYLFQSGWTGSWIQGNFSGTTWKDTLTGDPDFKLDGTSIDSTIFDNNFLVSADGKTLTMVPEPSSLALLSLGGLALLRRRRK